MTRIRKTLRYDEDILEQLENHKDKTGTPKQITAQLGVYIATRLAPASFQKCLDKMNRRKKLKTGDVKIRK